MESIITPYSNLKNKSNKIKDWYSIDFIKIFSDEILKNHKSFKKNDFIKDYNKNYKTLELKDRLKLISSLILKYLDLSYRQQLNILNKMMGPEWPHEEGMLNHGFFLYPVAQFIESHAQEDINESLKFIKELTKRFTGEWAIRTVANFDEKLCLKTMKEWSKDKNFHVRRLSSEGLRAKLPWGQGIQWVNENPKKTLPIYNKLRNDKSLYVRRSVANSMGDMIKIKEDLAFETLSSWLDKKVTEENLWVVKHAIRHPIKHKKQKFLRLQKKIETLKKSL